MSSIVRNLAVVAMILVLAAYFLIDNSAEVDLAKTQFALSDEPDYPFSSTHWPRI